MNDSVFYSLAIIFVITAVTVFTRFAPFILFGNGKSTPPVIGYLGAAMPSAIIILLVVYCLRNVNVVKYPFGIPEAIACIITGLLHVWKRNTLISIGGGTILYMLLVQLVFQ